MITLKMLAKACGVSVATVSKALNGASDVGAETAARIQKISEEMGYIPNGAARNIRTNKSHTIGVILDEGNGYGLSHEFFAYILESFKKKISDLGYDIILIVDQPGPWGKDIISHVTYRNCDGVLVLAADSRAGFSSDLSSGKVPVVTIDYRLDNCSCVMSDNVQGASELMRYVHGMGHRKIALILGEDTPVTRLRAASYYKTADELGITIPDEYIIQSQYHATEFAQGATQKLLDLPDPPTCILYSDDFSVIGGKNELERRGMSCPEDVSVAGYDGIVLSMALSPKLTTVKQDTEGIGIAAAVEMARSIEEGVKFIPREITVPCKLVEGETIRRIHS